MTGFFTRPAVLWGLFVLFIAETIGFGVIMQIWDFQLIDEMSDPGKVRAHIGEMSSLQKSVHAWTTATLDVVYPLTYGALFAGLAARAFKPIYAVPALATIPVDLTEGLVQVMALTGRDDVLWLKAYVTPLKLLLFIAALLIAAWAAAVLGRRRWKRSV